MGNMLPCLVQQAGTGALAPTAMNTTKRRRFISLKLLMKAIHKMKKTPAGGPVKAAAKMSSLSSVEAAVEDGRGGQVLDEARISKSASTNNPKGAVLRSRLHGRGGGLMINKKGKQGVVRVKVVLTKEEAARLLSLTVGGQKHTAAQIVAEMRKMEARRAAANAAWRPALASIPEESS